MSNITKIISKFPVVNGEYQISNHEIPKLLKKIGKSDPAEQGVTSKEQLRFKILQTIDSLNPTYKDIVDVLWEGQREYKKKSKLSKEEIRVLKELNIIKN